MCGILGQVWYLIVSIPDLCPLSSFSPFLKMGETFTLSHSDGRDPSSRDLDKMTCRIGKISRQSFCSSRGRIWSGPGALSGFKRCCNLMMKFTEILRSGIFGDLFLMSSGGCDISWL